MSSRVAEPHVPARRAAGRVLAGLAAAATAACTTTVAVPVVKEAQQCEPAAAMLAACSEPAPIKAGVTFGEMMELSRQDREALRACALKHKSLADAMADCKARIDNYNAEIRELNARNAKR